MNKHILEKRLFTSLLINENGIIYKKNRDWVEIVGGIISVSGIIALMMLVLIIL